MDCEALGDEMTTIAAFLCHETLQPKSKMRPSSPIIAHLPP